MFRPKEIDELNTAVLLLVPTQTDYCGTPKLVYPQTGDLLYVNWKSYGGTEVVIDKQIVIIDTAKVTTWYDPRIKKGCRLLRLDSGEQYEIKGKPNDIDDMHLYMQFKVENIESAAIAQSSGSDLNG